MMKKFFSKALAVSMAAIFCALSLAACGQSEPPDWDGSFYMNVGEDHDLIFSFYTEGDEGGVLQVDRTDADLYGSASVSAQAWIDEKNPGVAEDDYFRYTLKGDELTVKSIDGEDFTLEFEGSYTRGEALSEIDYGGDSDDGSDYGDVSLHTDVYYSVDGDENQLTLLFSDNGTMVFSEPDWESAEIDYYVNGSTVTIQTDGSPMDLELQGDGSLLSEEGQVFIMR